MMVMLNFSRGRRLGAGAAALVNLSWRIKHVWTVLGRPLRDARTRNGNYPKMQSGPGETRKRFAACPARAPHATTARRAIEINEEHPKGTPMKKLILSALVVIASSAAALAQD